MTPTNCTCHPGTTCTSAASCATARELHYGARLQATPEPDDDDKWRDVALRFDKHRMQALWHLQAMLQDPARHADIVRKFLKDPTHPAAATPEPDTCRKRPRCGRADPCAWLEKQATPEPIPMVLHCPKCGMQHVDKPNTLEKIVHRQSGTVVDELWSNPPHRSHLCHGCGTIWRPADVPTTGVKSISTKGKADTWEPGQATPEPAGDAGFIQLAETLRRIQHSAGLGRDDRIAMSHAADTLATLQATHPAPGVPEIVQRNAARWNYAMDWDNCGFAVCRRVGATGTCWEPIKTNGPIDAAMLAAAQAGGAA